MQKRQPPHPPKAHLCYLKQHSWDKTTWTLTLRHNIWWNFHFAFFLKNPIQFTATMKSYLFYPFILIKNLSYGSGRLRPEETVTSPSLSSTPNTSPHFTHGPGASPLTADESTTSRKASKPTRSWILQHKLDQVVLTLNRHNTLLQKYLISPI